MYVIVDEPYITDDLDHSIREALVGCFPKDGEHFAHQRWWHSPHHWTVVALDDRDRVVGGICVVEREISVRGKTLKIAGIGNVCTVPEWRKKGVVDRIMDIVLNEARRRGREAGFLFCKRPLEKVYARMGWKRIEYPVFMDDGEGKKIPMKEQDIAMGLPLSDSVFPEGVVDLRGRDW